MNPQLRLQKWREGLLDLTRRNRLIHFNPDTSPQVRAPHGIRLAKPDIETLWDRIALHERNQSFYALESEAEALEADDWESERTRAPVAERPLQNNEIRAFPDGPKLVRALANLRTRAQTSLAEQGINTLFVAFGFLRWRDKDNKELLSPLFLVPVALLRKSPRDPFKMRGLGEDAILNPALQLKLKSDFGLDLPAALPTLEGTIGQSVEAQLRQIETLVRARFADWRVESWAFLGLFSFHKIAMFNDLRDNGAPLAAHPLVRAVCGETGALAAREIIAAHELDALPPAEAQLVVEADSSQHRAIVAARRGASFVLQGPPGTGKSQTITNIIAECLENGKTVLFVSEKMAALDVVLGRLQTIGLGDACLELHSSKANKKEVIYELGRTLNLGAPPPPASPDESHELRQLRARLSANARQVHEPVAPTMVSVYQAIGRAASFGDAPDLPFRLDEAPFRAAAELSEIERWLTELQELADVAGNAAAHPWRGVQLASAGLEARGRLLLACDNAVQNASRLENSWPALAKIWGFDAQVSDLKTLDGALQTLELARGLQRPKFALHALQSIGEGGLVQRAYLASLRSLAGNGAQDSAQLNARLASWRASFGHALLQHDPRALAEALAGAQWWWTSAGSGAALQRDAPVLRRAFAPSDDALGALSSDIREKAALLARQMERAAPTNCAQTATLTQIVGALGSLDAVPDNWWTSDGQTGVAQALRDAEQTFAAWRAAGDEIAANWDLMGALKFDAPEFAPAQRAHFVASQAPSANRDAADLTADLAQLRACGARVAAQLGLQAPRCLADAIALRETGESIGDCPPLEAVWLDAQNWQRARQLLSEARSNYARRPQLRANLDAQWNAERQSELSRDAEALARAQPLVRETACAAWEHLAANATAANATAANATAASAAAANATAANAANAANAPDAAANAASVGEWLQKLRRARECGARWRAELGEADEWTAAQLAERAHALSEAALCHPQSVLWLRFKGDLTTGTRALRAEIEAVSGATRELASRWKKGAAVAAFVPAWDAQLVTLNGQSAPQLRREWSGIVETEVLASGGDVDALGHSWAQVAESAARLATQCGVAAPANARAARELLRVSEVIGESVALPSQWLAPAKLAEVERLWRETTQAEQLLADARANCEIFQVVSAEMLPDEIIARWGNYDGWFARLGAAYRADKARVAALYAGAPLPAGAQIALDLEKLRVLRQAQRNAESARRALDLVAPELAGVSAQLEAARALSALGQSWTAQQCAFIEGRERAGLRAHSQIVRASFDVLARTVAAMCERAASEPIVVPHPDAPFAAVAAWSKARAALLRPDEFSPALVTRDFATANQLAQRRQKNAPNLKNASAMFGALWNDGQPDWAELFAAVAQFERTRALGAWPETLAARCFGTALARDGARELADVLADFAHQITAKLDERAPAQFVGPDANWLALETALRSLDNYRVVGWDLESPARAAAEMEELRAIEAALQHDQIACSQSLGARFDGADTDWPKLETALQSAHEWTSTPPSARIAALLTGLPADKAELETELRALDAALEKWQSALQNAGGGQLPDARAEFGAIEWWIGARALHRRPREWDFAAWDAMLAARKRYRDLGAQIEAHQADWARAIGARWRGADTNFAASQRALRQTVALCELCGEVSGAIKMVAQHKNGAAQSAIFASWKAASGALAQAQTKWRALIAELGASGWFVPAFCAGQAPEQLEWEALLGAVEQRAPALLAGLSAIEIIAESAARDWQWDDEAARAMLREAAQIRALQAQWDGQNARLQREFGALYAGLQTDWDAVNQGVAELEKLIAAAGQNGLSAAFRAQLKAGGDGETERRRVAELRAELESALVQVAAAFPRDEVWKSCSRLSLGQIRSRLSRKISARDELEAWLRFADLVERGQQLGLASALEISGGERFLDLLMGQSVPAAQIGRAFWRRFWALWLHDLAPHHAALRSWNGAAHSAQTRHFAEADERSQGRAALSLRHQLAARRDEVQPDYRGELAVLRHEVGKSRSHIALRQLFVQIPQTVQKLKPCFLMSPLSVAHFLAWDTIKFDVVVFDEASQICPEDAIGAIGRAAQMIVVGDKQQLPPSRIFAQAALEDEFDEDATDESATDESAADEPQEISPIVAPFNEAQNGDIESILAFCETAGLPQLSLLWHYRSRHEELIAFSNRHFYDARLQTFPAPARAGRGALEWIKVAGFYQPSSAGAGRAGGTNRIEARHVAQMVATHARQTPHFSLGIITFNEPQRRAVEEEITRLRLHDDDLERFLDEDAPEPFFVKALENVQGDERDAIFFSVGFGPRRGLGGQVLPMLMSFGPLNKEGGERRLNVAVTRAKHQIKIVTSFDPSQIRSEKLKYKGGKLLRSYLEWASADKGSAPLQSASGADDLARAVARALELRGWRCALNVGLGDYRVDVGVADARAPEAMKLGVTLDGPFYISAASARDRDRLRPLVLRQLGWDLWPLWSLDCAREFERQIEKIDAHLRAQT